MTSEPRLGAQLYDGDEIAARVRTLGRDISEHYAGCVPVLLTVLKGATVFAADLTRRLSMPHEMDFLALSAYGEGASGAQAQILKDLQVPIAGRDVLLVEDVVDTGLTLRFLVQYLRHHAPASIEVVTLLDRPHRRLVDEPVRFRGFTVPDRFYVGYGFDYRQRYRNLPGLHELELDEPTRRALLEVESAI
ncbi:MAG: hypoxanthine phosphoribosyltransferase [Thermoleophilia bacterium]|nr:hypoxanthine phosphoribosyltransferase [Thermoleophilia bacterium]